MAQQLRLAMEDSSKQVSELNTTIQLMDWLGPSQNEFQDEAGRALAELQSHVQHGKTLATRIEHEVAEWDQMAAQLAGSPIVVSIQAGGGFNWAGGTALPVVPVFARLFISPTLEGLPKWLRELFIKFFPQEPASTGSDENPRPVKTKLGEILEEQVTPAAKEPTRDPELSPSHGDYVIYYDVEPKSQGNAYGSAACLPTSLSMVTSYYNAKDAANRAVSVDEFLNMLDEGDGHRGRGVGLDKLNDDLNEVGYQNVSNFQSDMTGLKDELKSGPVVVNVKANLLSSPERSMKEGNTYNHAMVVKAISDTNVLVNDPWTGKEIELSQEQFARMWAKGEYWLQTIHP